MKKVLLVLGCCATLAACNSAPDKKAEMTATERANSQAEPEDKPTPLTQDSAAGTRLSAVDHQMQVDTNASKIGTAPVGKPAGKGAQLVAASDCGSCHRENEKLLGPAYHDVALKYPDNDANVTKLAKKVISGGKGNWGDIAMTPHPGLSESDAKEMIRYVLSLR
jgi:cytochrome c